MGNWGFSTPLSGVTNLLITGSKISLREITTEPWLWEKG